MASREKLLWVCYPRANRLFHGFFSATLGASLIVHFYFALLIKKNWVETKSMITGRVPLREYLDSHSLLD